MTAIIQRSFAGGELGPSLYARVDNIKYQTGLKTCRNFIVLKSGGVSNRAGTQYIAEVKVSSKRIVKIPFIFNDDQTYVLEFGDQYMRVIRNGVQLTVSGVTAWSNATAYVVGDLVSRLGINYYCILAHTNQQPPDATYWYPLTGNIYEIPTPYLEDDLPELKYNQSADVIILTHRGYAVRELARTGHTNWTLSLVTFAPSQVAPTGVTNNGAAGSATEWVVTAVNAENFEESLQSSATGSSATPSSGSPITVSWTGAAGAGEYNVYKKRNGVYGFIGVAIGTSFIDNGIEADVSDTPPTARNPFGSTDNYPATSTYVQQRLTFGNTNNDPEKIWMGRTGHFKNFTTSTPLQDDDAVTFNIAGRRVNEVRHLIELDKLLVFSSGGEWSIEGDDAGIIRPGQVNPKQRSYRGASIVTPVIVGNSIVYVQARGSIIRDLANDAIEGYKGNDLTIFSPHLFEGYTIIDMAYQENPNSIVWIIREDMDGVRSLIGLTYVKEHQVWAWHRHDTDGEPERICVVPEGNEDYLYVTVKRTINSQTKRYIERMYSRRISDIKDAVFMDSALTYDGRNTNLSHTMELTGSGWTSDDTLNLESSASFFVSGDVGNVIFLYDTDGSVIRATITAFIDTENVEVTPNRDVPIGLQATPITDWTKAVDSLTGLDHLEGKDVAVFADGYVVASPNNESYEILTVSGGAITLDQPYGVIHVGESFMSDLETLDIDTTNSETMVDKKRLVGKVVLQVNETRGLFIGQNAPTDDSVDPLENLYEAKIRELEGYDEPVDLLTGVLDVSISANWLGNGRVFIRQVDPIPASILSITPVGMMPIRG